MASRTSGRRARHAGIEIRHQAGCPGEGGAGCTCAPTYRAKVYSKRDQRTLRKSFSNLSEAKAWRTDAQVALRAGSLNAAPSVRLSIAAEGWLVGARSGAIRNRSGYQYKPSTIRGYEQALRLRILPLLGATRLADIRRSELQVMIDRLLADGHDPSTIRNSLLPVRAIFRRALARGEVAVNPTTGLELPAVRSRRERVASPDEAAKLLDALSKDRALWATAVYGGLRLGELQALTWDAVDLAEGVLHVERSWDPREGPILPKTRASVRTVPVATVLRQHLVAHRLQSGRSAGLVFGRTADVPLSPSSVNQRAQLAWRNAGLARITLHECRHTYASFMIAAGCNAKALCVYMGHSSVTVTFDLYGHLMPGNEAEAADLLDAYLESRSPSAQLGGG